MVSRAIAKAKQDLTAGGLTQETVEEKLSAFPVTTVGGASYTFAPGPNYAHIVNLCDAVPMLFGAAPTSLLSDSIPLETFASQSLPSNLPPVSGGLVNYLARAGEQLAHGCEEHYFKYLSLRAI